MKTIILTLLMFSTIFIYAQTDTLNEETIDTANTFEEMVVEEETIKNYEDDEKPLSKSDTTKIRIGKKSIKVINDGEDTYISVIDSKDEKNKDFDFEIEDEDMKFKKEKKGNKFEGHWAGIELGLNTYDGSVPNFMQLNSNRSFNWNINMFQHSFGLFSKHVGLVSGLGFEFNNYRFDNANSIEKDDDGFVVGLDLDPDLNVEKSKLTTVYLTCPLLLEFQIPVSSNKDKDIHISGGVIGGLKTGSYTKVKYSSKGKPGKNKTKDDFNLAPFRYGVTARIGYDGLNIFAIYYLTPMFEKSDENLPYNGFKGPELNPFALGLALPF
ncbi:hypothetical protein ACFLTE_05175 [Bacteroidota bacterium]